MIRVVSPLVLLALAAPLACSAPPASESTGGSSQGIIIRPPPIPIPHIDPCLGATADVTYVVPDDPYAIGNPIPSGDAASFYRSGCRGFIVDTTLTPTSNGGGTSGTNPGVWITAQAWDLPGTQYGGQFGFIPATQLDCQSYAAGVSYYLKNPGDTSFSYAGGYFTTGTWNGTTCQLNQTGAGMGVENPASGNLTLRSVSFVQMRSSGQQVGVQVANWL